VHVRSKNGQKVRFKMNRKVYSSKQNKKKSIVQQKASRGGGEKGSLNKTYLPAKSI